MTNSMKAPIKTLTEMLTYCRPMGSRTEKYFRTRYLLNLPGAFVDIYKNIHVPVGTSRCLWSSHTDTVHRTGGMQGLVTVDGDFVQLSRKSKSSCLGADDTVGVFLMREMILAGVPGYYIFHHGEEQGGWGSSDIARNHSEWLSNNFDLAIALDRKGRGDVITHQGGRCCSEVFALALGEALNCEDHRFSYAPTTGVYTDTAEYVDAIPECTNLSVGYDWQHTPDEFVDLEHVARLLPALCALDTKNLPIVRDPQQPDPDLRSFRQEFLGGSGFESTSRFDGGLNGWSDYTLKYGSDVYATEKEMRDLTDEELEEMRQVWGLQARYR